MLGDLFKAEGDQAGGRSHRGIQRTGLHRGIDLVRGHIQHRGSGFLEHHVHLLAAAADLQALGIRGIDDRRGAAGNTARLPDPADDDHALVGQHFRQRFADLGVLPFRGLLVGGDHTGHQSDVRFRHFAAGIIEGHQRHVQRTFPQGTELGIGLHQRRTGVDGSFQGATAAFLDLCGETAAQPVAEVASVDSAAGKLVGYLQGYRIGSQGRAGEQRTKRGCCETHKNAATSNGHWKSPFDV